MRFDVQLNITGMFLKDPKKAMGIFAEEFGKLFEEATSFCMRAVVRGTPVFRGALSEATFREVRGTGLALHGLVANPLAYAGFIETGRPAHTPDFNQLAEWVRTKMGLEGAPLYAVTRAIAQKISKSGIRPRSMFQKGFETAKMEIPKMIEKTESRIIQRWNS